MAKQYISDDPKMMRNDVGDNIADRADTFCELVTQYWVWKNINNLDYYGFCHYRRFISFGKEMTPDIYANVYVENYSSDYVKLMGYDRDDLDYEVLKYDIILTEPWDVSKSGINDLYDEYSHAVSLYGKDLLNAVEIIDYKYPEYSIDATKYLNGKLFYPCNMFIMKREIFVEYSEWLFSILFELERITDTSLYSKSSNRMIGHVGERLLGIFVTHKMRTMNYRIGIKQRVCFGKIPGKDEYLPHFKENNVPVVFSTNDYFSLYTASTIMSLIKCSSDGNNYDLYILHSGLSKESESLITSVCNKDNVSITFVNVQPISREYVLKPNFHISVETFYRLFMPELFKNYDKMLYLDSDLIILKDVAELYHEDIDEYMVAGVIDIDFISQYNGGRKETKDYVENDLKLKDPYSYYQAGVLLFNLKEMRKNLGPLSLVNYVDGRLLTYGDQDVINKVCEGKIKTIDMRWNVVHFCNGARSSIINNWAPRELSEEYYESRTDPFIIHYAGYSKPWSNINDDFADQYWDAIRNSNLYEKNISRISNRNVSPSLVNSKIEDSKIEDSKIEDLIMAILKKIVNRIRR